jgi:signal transduction histidine kinase
MHPPPCQENACWRALRALARRLDALLSARHRLLWAVRVRWLVIGGFLGLAVFSQAFGLFASIRPCVEAAVIGALMNAANAYCVRRGRWVVWVTALAIPLDHVLITYVVLGTGGAQSPFVMMYVVQVLATAMLVDTVVAAGSALLGVALFGLGIGAQMAGFIQMPSLVASGDAPSLEIRTGIWAAYLVYCLGLLVYLGGYISERLRSSEAVLEQRNRELEAAIGSLRLAHDQLKLSYERLTETEAQLVHSEKMRGLGQLVAGVAHELNNPLSFVCANVEHIRGAVARLRQWLDAYAAVILSPDEERRLSALRAALRLDDTLAELPAMLDDCGEGARRAARIVHEMRAFARGGQSEARRPCDLHRGLESTLVLLAHRFGDRITIHRNYGDLPLVDCDLDQLNQVFMNLLANAADAIGSGHGNVFVSTRRLEGLAEAAVAITVHDDGPGMTPEVRRRVFEPFFTTKEVGRGTGLGLSVSYGIVERHGGTITVESSPGNGASFTVNLPIRHKKH